MKWEATPAAAAFSIEDLAIDIALMAAENTNAQISKGMSDRQ
ncbi:hypothetical protein [Glutamicibacter sp.]|nr:hypothetical protein [Glutamicibacter sp.]